MLCAEVEKTEWSDEEVEELSMTPHCFIYRAHRGVTQPCGTAVCISVDKCSCRQHVCCVSVEHSLSASSPIWHGPESQPACRTGVALNARISRLPWTVGGLALVSSVIEQYLLTTTNIGRAFQCKANQLAWGCESFTPFHIAALSVWSC